MLLSFLRPCFPALKTLKESFTDMLLFCRALRWCVVRERNALKEKGIQYFFYCDVPCYFRLEMWQKWQCCKLDKKARGNPLVLMECHDVWNVQHVVISEVVAECIPNWTVPLTRLWKGEWTKDAKQSFALKLKDGFVNTSRLHSSILEIVLMAYKTPEQEL